MQMSMFYNFNNGKRNNSEFKVIYQSQKLNLATPSFIQK